MLHCLTELSRNRTTLDAKTTDNTRLSLRVFLYVFDIVILDVLAGVVIVVTNGSTDFLDGRELHL